MPKIQFTILGMLVMAITIYGIPLNSTEDTIVAAGEKGGFNSPCDTDADCLPSLICTSNKICFFRPPPMPVLPPAVTDTKLGVDENCKKNDDCKSTLQCTDGKCIFRAFEAPPPADCTVAGCPGSGLECDSKTKTCRSLAAV